MFTEKELNYIKGILEHKLIRIDRMKNKITSHELAEEIARDMKPKEDFIKEILNKLDKINISF